MYNVILTPKFKKDLKFYETKRKYRNIEDDIDETIEDLENGNLIGSPLSNIKLPDGENTYKVRIANSNTKSGKSNGYRLLYYAIKNDETIYLLTIYYKKDGNRILSDKEIIDIIKQYCI
jgi:mRNA-degrading endonuclease RelE of RelBE toxin-antitoxin system